MRIKSLDHSAPDHFEKALALTGGRGYDVILEMLANVNLGRDLPILALGGRVVVIGSRGSIEIDPRDMMGRDAASSACLSGMQRRTISSPSTRRSSQASKIKHFGP